MTHSTFSWYRLISTERVSKTMFDNSLIELLKEAVEDCSTVEFDGYEATFNHPNQVVISVADGDSLSDVVSIHYLNMRLLDYGSLKTSIERAITEFEDGDDDVTAPDVWSSHANV